MANYLDNMSLRDGDVVICRTDMLNNRVEAGKKYAVKLGWCMGSWHAGIYDNTGKWVVPSGRFEKSDATVNHDIDEDTTPDEWAALAEDASKKGAPETAAMFAQLYVQSKSIWTTFNGRWVKRQNLMRV